MKLKIKSDIVVVVVIAFCMCIALVGGLPLALNFLQADILNDIKSFVLP